MTELKHTKLTECGTKNHIIAFAIRERVVRQEDSVVN